MKIEAAMRRFPERHPWSFKALALLVEMAGQFCLVMAGVTGGFAAAWDQQARALSAWQPEGSAEQLTRDHQVQTLSEIAQSHLYDTILYVVLAVVLTALNRVMKARLDRRSTPVGEGIHDAG